MQMINESVLNSWKRRFRVESDDAKQEGALAKLEGLTKPQLRQRMKRVGRHDLYRTYSIDFAYDDHTLLDYLTSQEETDSTYDRVLQAFGYWINDQTLTLAQAEAILMHDVDLISIEHIAEIYGMHRTSVAYHYERGIRRLRERYGQSLYLYQCACGAIFGNSGGWADQQKVKCPVCGSVKATRDFDSEKHLTLCV